MTDRAKRNWRRVHPAPPVWHHPVNIARTAHDSRADKAVDRFVIFFGSLRYIAWQTVFIIIWIGANATMAALRWDPYAFILLNLAFSMQATYAAPLILLSQNRAAEHDRARAENDYVVNENALAEIQANTELTEQVRVLTAEVRKLVDASTEGES